MYSQKPYILEPPIARLAQRAALAATYIGMFVVGFVSVTAVTVAYLVPLGWALMGLSILAIFGIVSSRYRWEWGSLPFIITIVLVMAVSLISVTVGFSVWLLLTIAAHMSYRFLYLTIIAKRLRETDTPEPLVSHV